MARGVGDVIYQWRQGLWVGKNKVVEKGPAGLEALVGSRRIPYFNHVPTLSPAEASIPVMPIINTYPYLINNHCNCFIESLPHILTYMVIYL